ncbi:MAG: class I SAM-dependent methyltransferase [Magnetovibrio sp.]|nr:class I SAM-dependent methyltransferase [Magnetovibrio sp.]
MVSQKHTYYQKRSALISDQGMILANRELQTLQKIEEIIGHKLIVEGMTVCDAGCGGKYLEPIFDDMGAHYIGYDIEDLNLETDTLPISDASVDLVLNYAVIEHLADPSIFLSESHRVLKEGGALIVVTPNWQHSKNEFYNDYTHVKPYTPSSLRKILADFGFGKVFDFPNLRCKSAFSYTNQWKYFLAAHRPFLGTAPSFIPEFLKGRAKGIMAVAIK